MNQILTGLLDLSIEARDGDIGSVHDVLFDDESWTIRYLVIDTGKWLPGRKVLLSPCAVRAIAWGQRQISVDLTREEVKNSPHIDTDKPVSRQYERAYFDYYGYPYYWMGTMRWGAVAFPPVAALRAVGGKREPNIPNAAGERLPVDPNLRSAKAVMGYHIAATDGEIGHVEDFIYAEQDWSLQSLVVDTRNWLPGAHVAVSIRHVEAVSWEHRTVRISLTQQAIGGSPKARESLAPTDSPIESPRNQRPRSLA